MKPFFEPYSAQQNAVEGLERHLRALEEKRKELLDVDNKRLVGNMNDGCVSSEDEKRVCTRETG